MMLAEPKRSRSHRPARTGGGIRGGQTFGRSDKIAGLPADNPVHAGDFVATIYHALCYGHDAKVVDVTGRPHFIVQGKPVEALFR